MQQNTEPFSEESPLTNFVSCFDENLIDRTNAILSVQNIWPNRHQTLDSSNNIVLSVPQIHQHLLGMDRFHPALTVKYDIHIERSFTGRK